MLYYPLQIQGRIFQQVKYKIMLSHYNNHITIMRPHIYKLEYVY